jgi:hypothetical protein
LHGWESWWRKLAGRGYHMLVLVLLLLVLLLLL